MVRRLALACIVASSLVAAPGLAWARAGGGSSMGSRGGMTFSAPPSTMTAPSVAPIQRSYTPRSEPSYTPGYGGPAYGNPGYARGGFTSGLMGGLIGAGIGGLLFGHGLFGGINGGGSLLGLLIQLAILFFVGRWILRLVLARQPSLAGFGGFGGGLRPGSAPPPRRGAPPITITPADYATFEQLLKAMQTAWSNGDLAGLRTIATPEMVGYFNEQLSQLASRGCRNIVRDVRLERGDLSQAWSEGNREYATVAMRFSMHDWTEDASGQVVDGSPNERQVVTEVWTFLRSPGGRWVLSAIQQGR